MTSQTVGPGGGTIGPVSGGSTETAVVIPAGAFLTPLQVTITQPDVADIGNAGLCGYQAVAGIGVIIQNPANESVSYSFFTDPLVITISSPGIEPGDIIVAWDGDRFVRVGVAEHSDSVTVKLTHAGYNFFAVLSPAGRQLGSCSTSGGGALGTTFGGGIQAGLSSLRQFGSGATFLAGLFRLPIGTTLPGIGVLAPRWAHAITMPIHSVGGLAALTAAS